MRRCVSRRCRGGQVGDLAQVRDRTIVSAERLLEASNRVRRPLGGRNVELLEQPLGDRLSDPSRAELAGDAFDANLVQLVQCHQCVAMLGGGDAGRVEQSVQHAPVIHAQGEVDETELGQNIRYRRHLLDFDDWRGRPDRVDVALVELAEPSARRPVGAPDRLNLISLEELRQLVLVLRDDARERHGEVVAQGEIGLAALLVLAAAEDLENELVAFLAVLAEQRLDVLERRRFERLEPVALVDAPDDADDVLAPADVVGEEVACAGWWFC